MKLAVEKRVAGKKGMTNRLRRDGHIPAIIYGLNQAGMPIHVKGDEIKAVLRNIEPGRLATTIFELAESGHGKHQKAIIKEIQYHVATYEVEHIDFALISEEVPVTVKVPVLLTGVAECVGVQKGGFIRQVARSFKVTCLPRHIPQQLIVDVRELDIGQSKKFADLSIPSHVRPLVKLDGVVVVIGKKAGT